MLIQEGLRSALYAPTSRNPGETWGTRVSLDYEDRQCGPSIPDRLDYLPYLFAENVSVRTSVPFC